MYSRDTGRGNSREGGRRRVPRAALRTRGSGRGRGPRAPRLTRGAVSLFVRSSKGSTPSATSSLLATSRVRWRARRARSRSRRACSRRSRPSPSRCSGRSPTGSRSARRGAKMRSKIRNPSVPGVPGAPRNAVLRRVRAGRASRGATPSSPRARSVLRCARSAPCAARSTPSRRARSINPEAGPPVTGRLPQSAPLVPRRARAAAHDAARGGGAVAGGVLLRAPARAPRGEARADQGLHLVRVLHLQQRAPPAPSFRPTSCLCSI